MKVLSLNGYFDAVTPFFQTKLDLLNMPLDPSIAKNNLTLKHYPSGHMIYLDRESRVEMKADLVAFYDAATSPAPTREARPQVRSPHRRDAKARRSFTVPAGGGRGLGEKRHIGCECKIIDELVADHTETHELLPAYLADSQPAEPTADARSGKPIK
jgi:hypothetical protein